MAAASPKLGRGIVLAGLELGRNDGPWVIPDRLRKVNGILRYSRGDQRNGFSATATSYVARWHSTDQAPVRANPVRHIDAAQEQDKAKRGDYDTFELQVGDNGLTFGPIF